MNPHLREAVSYAGAALEHARVAVILLHGRGGSASEMLRLAQRLELPDLAFVAISAAEQSWYPQRFMQPLEQNQPFLDFALERVHGMVEALIARGFETPRLALLGFSQGACLASEYAVRHPAPYAALIAFTGGLIGPPGTSWNENGHLSGTPVLLTNSETDPWVPLERTQHSAAVFERMGAQVRLEVSSDPEHRVRTSELTLARGLLASP